MVVARTMRHNLQPIEPCEAYEWYLDERKDELSEATHRAHGHRLSAFVKWCEAETIGNLNDVSGRELARYKKARRQKVKNVTLHSQLSTLRVFIKWCEGIDAVRPGLHEGVQVPSLNKDENVSKTKIEPERVKDAVEFLRKFHYATRDHAIMELLWHTGMRTGALRGLDVEDYSPQTHHLELRHRTDEGTPLKNEDDGERWVQLSPKVCEVLDDYVAHHRKDSPDDYGRDPLITSRFGRLGKATIRHAVYAWTRPCAIGKDCPEGKDPEECTAAQDRRKGYGCPVNVSPHPIRKASISYFLEQSDIHYDDVSGRCDVSPDVLKAHYDQRSQERAMRSRGDKFVFDDE